MDMILKYFPGISTRQQEQFVMFKKQFCFWNERINLVSRKDIDQLEERHILHSLAIAKIVSFKTNAGILDIGTGGGFPGIPLAILFPQANFHLVDSIKKKIMVVDSLAKELGLNNINAEQVRAEKIGDVYDFIVSRAVTALPKMVSWCGKNINSQNHHEINNGFLALKGGDLKSEVDPYKNNTQIFPVSRFFQEAYFQTKKVVYYSPFSV